VDGTLRFRDLATGKEETAPQAKDVPLPLSMTFSPDGATLATGHPDAALRLWQVKTRELTATEKLRSSVSSLNFARDGKALAAGTWVMTGVGSELKVFRLPGREVRTSGILPAVMFVAFTPDGNTLAVGGLGKVQLVDPDTAKERFSLVAPGGEPLTAGAVSADGTMFAAASESSAVTVWDVKARKVRATLKSHAGYVRCLAFGPEGKSLASGAEDRTVRLWDVEAGTQRHLFQGHSAPVLALTFTRDGATLLSADRGVNVKRWDPRTGQEKTEGKP